MTIQTQNVSTSMAITNGFPKTGLRTVVCEYLGLTDGTTGTRTLKVAAAATFILTSSSHLQPMVKVSTAMNLSSTVTTHTVTKPTLVSTLTGSSTAYRVVKVSVAERLALTSPVVLHPETYVTANLNLTSSISSKAVRAFSFSDSLALSSTSTPVRRFSVAEHLNLSATSTYTNHGYQNLQSLINFSSSVLLVKAVNQVAEHVALTSAYTTKVHTTPWVYDTITFSSSANYPVTNTGWWMNSMTTAMTQFDNLPFTSMAVINGRIFGMGPAGLYEMTGDNDSGVDIDASVTTGYSLLGQPQKKRVTDVYLNGWSEAPMTLTVSVDGTQSGDYSYTVPQRDTLAPRGNRVTLAKGLNSVYWKFSLANQNGGDFDIEQISVDVNPSTNRRV